MTLEDYYYKLESERYEHIPIDNPIQLVNRVRRALALSSSHTSKEVDMIKISPSSYLVKDGNSITIYVNVDDASHITNSEEFTSTLSRESEIINHIGYFDEIPLVLLR